MIVDLLLLTLTISNFFMSKCCYSDNPLGMKGRLAQLYAKLVNSLWEGTSKNLPPVELRYTLSKYAPQFTGYQQHDAQELLSFLLDGLHEDLNRYIKISVLTVSTVSDAYRHRILKVSNKS